MCHSIWDWLLDVTPGNPIPCTHSSSNLVAKQHQTGFLAIQFRHFMALYIPCYCNLTSLHIVTIGRRIFSWKTLQPPSIQIKVTRTSHILQATEAHSLWSTLKLKYTPYANRHTNTVQLLVPQARTNQFKYSFIPSTTERWNGLHFDTNGITSLTSFKHCFTTSLIMLSLLFCCC